MAGGTRFGSNGLRWPAAFASIGLPGLNGFVGEFLVLLGSFGRFPLATLIATTVAEKIDLTRFFLFAPIKIKGSRGGYGRAVALY